MDVALNVGAQLGGIVRKEVKPEVGTAAQGRGSEEHKGATKKGGEAKDFLAAISNQTVANKEDATEEITSPDDPNTLPFKLQFRDSAVLRIDDAESKSVEPQPRASVLLTLGEIERTQYELQNQVSAPSVIDTSGDELDVLQPDHSTAFEISDAKSELLVSKSDAPATVTGEVAGIKFNGPQSDAPTLFAIGDTQSGLPGPKSNTSVLVMREDTDIEFSGPQSDASIMYVIGDTKSTLPGPKLNTSALVTGEDTDNGVSGPQSDALAPLAIDAAENELGARQSPSSTPVATDDAESGLLALGGNGQTERLQNVGQASIRPAGTDDPEKPRRPSLQGVKTAVVQNTETPAPLNSQPASLSGKSQLVLPDAEKAITEEIRTTERQTPQPYTQNEQSRTILSRQASPYLSTPASPAILPELVASNGEVISSDLDFDIAADFSSGRRLIGQAASVSQALTSPTTTQAQAVGAIAQVIAAIKANGRSDTIEIRLDPPELGRVKIDFTMETMDSVKAVLSAERGETLDHMRKNIGELAAQLKNAGFNSIEFEFAKNGEREFLKEGHALEISDNDDGSLPPPGQGDIVYLSMRSDAQLDVLA